MKDNRKKKGGFFVCLTHDVDWIRKKHQYFSHFFRPNDPDGDKFNLNHLKSFFDKEEPYWCFDRIIEIENKHDVKSTFFFLAQEKSKFIEFPSGSSFRYSLEEKKVKEIINFLEINNWEIGLHGSFSSFNDIDLLRKEKSMLEKVTNKKISGIRQHNLNISIPLTWEIQHEAGFLYDASHGSNYEVGFRKKFNLDDKFWNHNRHIEVSKDYFPNGNIQILHPFADDFFVVPITIMDGPLFKRNINPKKIVKKCLEIINMAKNNNLLLTLLWHQRVFNENEFPLYSKIYDFLISVCKKEGAIFIKANEIPDVF